MDSQTGQIHQFENEQQRSIIEDAIKAHNAKLIELAGLPKENCPHCYGRGYTGKNKWTGEVIVCRCCKKGDPT